MQQPFSSKAGEFQARSREAAVVADLEGNREEAEGALLLLPVE